VQIDELYWNPIKLVIDAFFAMFYLEIDF